MPSPAVTLRPIARMRTDMPQKFGLPRQSGVCPDLQGRIVFEPEYALPSAVRGLDGFTHLWVIWLFENGEPGGTAADVAVDAAVTTDNAAGVAVDAAAVIGTAAGDVATDTASSAGNTSKAGKPTDTANVSEAHGCTSNAPANGPASKPDSTTAARRWSPTVRPPRLGGSKRVGVFATRSPFRPNPIGLSCVRIDHIESTAKGPVIHVRGCDLRDGTPILDIKPYLPYADCQPTATGGFTDRIQQEPLAVDCPENLLASIPAGKREALLQVLAADPRPVCVDDPNRTYELAFAGFQISFTVADGTVHVQGIAAV